MSIALLDDDIGAALDEVETMRNASRHAERGSLDWPDLRRAVLAYGGIGPSRDWERDNYPADLYRANGNAPDVVAAEAVHPAPTGDLPPDGDWRLYSIARETYAHWLALNRPHYYKATVYLESPNADMLDREIASRVADWKDVRMVNLEAMERNTFKATVAELAGEPDAHEYGGRDA